MKLNYTTLRMRGRRADDKEVAAACRAAISAGADEIVLKDGHDSARNITAEALP